MIYFELDGVVFAFDDSDDSYKEFVPAGAVSISEGMANDIVNNSREKKYPRLFGNEKLDIFTTEEQLAIVTATMSDPIVKLMYDRLLGSAHLTYEDPEAEQGLSLLVEKELLTAERKSAIVALMQPQ